MVNLSKDHVVAAHMANKIELLVQVVGPAHEPASFSRSKISCATHPAELCKLSLAWSPKPPSNALAKPGAKLRDGISCWITG